MISSVLNMYRFINTCLCASVWCCRARGRGNGPFSHANENCLDASQRKSDPVKLNIRIGNSYIPVLSIPVDDCRCFALRPRSWLTFLGYTISGARGHISAAPSGNEVDYRLDVNEEYYFVFGFIHVVSRFVPMIYTAPLRNRSRSLITIDTLKKAT